MSSYEMKQWLGGEYGTELVEVPSYMIGHLLTKHHPECAVSMCLHRSAGDHDASRRVEEAHATVCTCGADKPLTLRPTGGDRRDTRDPEQVGLQILGDPSCQNSSSIHPSTDPSS